MCFQLASGVNWLSPEVPELADMDVVHRRARRDESSDPMQATARVKMERTATGSVTQSTMATISIRPWLFWRGEAIIQMMGTPIATTSPSTRLKTYAPIQKSERSPRSSASRQVGHSSRMLSQRRKIPRLPHRGQRNCSAQLNFWTTDDRGALNRCRGARRSPQCVITDQTPRGRLASARPPAAS